MPADVKTLVASGQASGWSKWLLVFAGAVLVTRVIVRAVWALVGIGADFGGAQRGAVRDLFRL
jgi:hypothetical protein